MAVTAAESFARRRISGRSRAWLVVYSLIGAGAGSVVLARSLAGRQKRPAPERPSLLAGLVLAGTGYQVGRLLLDDHPIGPPEETMWLETVALAGVVAPVEEIVWGGLVEPAAGVAWTGALFAAKHVAIDGRWRRWLGLAMFGWGLGLLRRRSRKLALAVHVGCNAAGVALGHLTGRDQF